MAPPKRYKDLFERKAVWVVIVIAVADGAYALLHLLVGNWKEKVGEEVQAIFLLTVLFLLLHFAMEARLKTEGELEYLSEEMDKLNEAMSTYVRAPSDLEQLQIGVDALMRKNPLIFGQMLREMFPKVVKILTVKADEVQITFADPDFALRSYIQFWDALLEYSNALHSPKPLTVFALHCTGMGIWSEALDLSQEEFCRDPKRGTITRILCGDAREPDAATLKTAEAMLKMKIRVYYFHIGRNPNLHDLTWDYLFVAETNHVVIWDLPQRHDAIRSAIFKQSLEHGGEQLREGWERIRQKSVELTLDEVRRLAGTAVG